MEIAFTLPLEEARAVADHPARLRPDDDPGLKWVMLVKAGTDRMWSAIKAAESPTEDGADAAWLPVGMERANDSLTQARLVAGLTPGGNGRFSEMDRYIVELESLVRANQILIARLRYERDRGRDV